MGKQISCFIADWKTKFDDIPQLYYQAVLTRAVKPTHLSMFYFDGVLKFVYHSKL